MYGVAFRFDACAGSVARPGIGPLSDPGDHAPSGGGFTCDSLTIDFSLSLLRGSFCCCLRTCTSEIGR